MSSAPCYPFGDAVHIVCLVEPAHFEDLAAVLRILGRESLYAFLGNGHCRQKPSCQGKQPVGADDDIAPVCFSRTGGVEELVFGIKLFQPNRRS